MKPTRTLLYTVAIIIANTLSTNISAQTSNDILELLVQKHIIKQQEADSAKAKQAVKEQGTDNKQGLFPVKVGRFLNVGGYTQFRYQDPQQRGTEGIAGQFGGFDIRRARLDFNGKLTSEWEYDLQADFAQSPKIIDAQAAYKPYEFLKVTVGQQKIPLSAENNKWSDSELELIDRAQVIEALTGRTKDVIGNQNGRDVGALVSAGFYRLPDCYLVNLQLGVFNGNGINVAGDNNRAKDLSGRLILKPIKGMEFGGSFYDGYDYFTTTAATAFNQKRTRVAGEVEYSYKEFTLRGEYIHGEDGGLQREGWYALAAYSLLPKKLQLVVRYDWYDPNVYNNTKAAASDRSTYLVGGVNYWFNSWSKLQVNYAVRKEESSVPAQTNNNLLSTQLQLQF